MQEHEVQSLNSEHMSYRVVKIFFTGLATGLNWLLSMNAVMDEDSSNRFEKVEQVERGIDSFR